MAPFNLKKAFTTLSSEEKEARNKRIKEEEEHARAVSKSITNAVRNAGKPSASAAYTRNAHDAAPSLVKASRVDPSTSRAPSRQPSANHAGQSIQPHEVSTEAMNPARKAATQAVAALSEGPPRKTHETVYERLAREGARGTAQNMPNHRGESAASRIPVSSAHNDALSNPRKKSNHPTDSPNHATAGTAYREGTAALPATIRPRGLVKVPPPKTYPSPSVVKAYQEQVRQAQEEAAEALAKLRKLERKEQERAEAKQRSEANKKRPQLTRPIYSTTAEAPQEAQTPHDASAAPAGPPRPDNVPKKKKKKRVRPIPVANASPSRHVSTRRSVRHSVPADDLLLDWTLADDNWLPIPATPPPEYEFPANEAGNAANIEENVRRAAEIAAQLEEIGSAGFDASFSAQSHGSAEPEPQQAATRQANNSADARASATDVGSAADVPGSATDVRGSATDAQMPQSAVTNASATAVQTSTTTAQDSATAVQTPVTESQIVEQRSSSPLELEPNESVVATDRQTFIASSSAAPSEPPQSDPSHEDYLINRHGSIMLDPNTLHDIADNVSVHSDEEPTSRLSTTEEELMSAWERDRLAGIPLEQRIELDIARRFQTVSLADAAASEEPSSISDDWELLDAAELSGDKKRRLSNVLTHLARQASVRQQEATAHQHQRLPSISESGPEPRSAPLGTVPPGLAESHTNLNANRVPPRRASRVNRGSVTSSPGNKASKRLSVMGRQKLLEAAERRQAERKTDRGTERQERRESAARTPSETPVPHVPHLVRRGLSLRETEPNVDLTSQRLATAFDVQERTPQPQVTMPEPQVTAPEPQVTVPEPQVTVPEPQVTVPEPQMTAPEPQVTTLEPQRSVPQPQTPANVPPTKVPLPKQKQERHVPPRPTHLEKPNADAGLKSKSMRPEPTNETKQNTEPGFTFEETQPLAIKKKSQSSRKSEAGSTLFGRAAQGDVPTVFSSRSSSIRNENHVAEAPSHLSMESSAPPRDPAPVHVENVLAGLGSRDFSAFERPTLRLRPDEHWSTQAPVQPPPQSARQRPLPPVPAHPQPTKDTRSPRLNLGVERPSVIEARSKLEGASIRHVSNPQDHVQPPLDPDSVLSNSTTLASPSPQKKHVQDPSPSGIASKISTPPASSSAQTANSATTTSSTSPMPTLTRTVTGTGEDVQVNANLNAGVYTDLDALISRIENPDTASRYDDLVALSEIMGPGKNPGLPQPVLESLPVIPVEQTGDSLTALGLLVSTCQICLDSFKNADLVVLLPECLHVFHQTCAVKWLRLQSVCPSCRVPVRVE